MIDECEEIEFESPDAEEALAENSGAEELRYISGRIAIHGTIPVIDVPTEVELIDADDTSETVVVPQNQARRLGYPHHLQCNLPVPDYQTRQLVLNQFQHRTATRQSLLGWYLRGNL